MSCDRALDSTSLGRARSGCGAALIGSPDQILSEIEEYKKMGIRAFIFSGYPHIDECEHFGKLIMPHAYNRVPNTKPNTPLGAGERK